MLEHKSTKKENRLGETLLWVTRPGPVRPIAAFRENWQDGPAINSPAMNSLPPPALVAALAAVIALPFSAIAAGTLLLTASLGFIIHADYAQRKQRIRLPRLSPKLRTSDTRTPFRGENHPLAA